MLLQMRRFAQRYFYYVQIFEKTRHFNGTIEHMKISEILEKKMTYHLSNYLKIYLSLLLPFTAKGKIKTNAEVMLFIGLFLHFQQSK